MHPLGALGSVPVHKQLWRASCPCYVLSPGVAACRGG